jgi:uncharacterized protein (DUF362 family)
MYENHGGELLSKVVVEQVPAKEALLPAVEAVFEHYGGLPALLRGRTRALIKINAVDFRPELTFHRLSWKR